MAKLREDFKLLSNFEKAQKKIFKKQKIVEKTQNQSSDEEKNFDNNYMYENDKDFIDYLELQGIMNNKTVLKLMVPANMVNEKTKKKYGKNFLIFIYLIKFLKAELEDHKREIPENAEYGKRT